MNNFNDSNFGRFNPHPFFHCFGASKLARYMSDYYSDTECTKATEDLPNYSIKALSPHRDTRGKRFRSKDNGRAIATFRNRSQYSLDLPKNDLNRLHSFPAGAIRKAHVLESAKKIETLERSLKCTIVKHEIETFCSKMGKRRFNHIRNKMPEKTRFFVIFIIEVEDADDSHVARQRYSDFKRLHYKVDIFAFRFNNAENSYKESFRVLCCRSNCQG